MLRRGAGEAGQYGAKPAAVEVTPKELKAMLTYPAEWGPGEWGEGQGHVPVAAILGKALAGEGRVASECAVQTVASRRPLWCRAAAAVALHHPCAHAARSV